LSDLTFGKKHLEDFVPEHLFQVLSMKTRRNSEHALAIKTAIRTQNVKVRIEPQEIAKALYGDNGPGHCIILRNRCLKKDLQGFPSAATQIGKEAAVIGKYRRRILGMLKIK